LNTADNLFRDVVAQLVASIADAMTFDLGDLLWEELQASPH
jgi:hypothetical protein